MIWGMLASLVAMRPADAAESYSRWKIERIIEIAIQYVADTKTEFARRAAAIEAETGEVVELDYQYFHEPTGAEQRKQEKFAAAKISDALAEKHIQGFLADLERVRKKLAEAEKAAFDSWAKRPVEVEAGEDLKQTAEIFGQSIESRRLGAILDNSPSMNPYVEKLREELAAAFPDYRYREVWGSFLRINRSGRGYGNSADGYEPWFYAKPRPDQNPFDPRFFNHEIPKQNVHYFVTGLERDNLSALRALVELEGVDTVYWFCDLDDKVEPRAISALAGLLKKHQAKLFLHTLKRSPPRALREVAEQSGGAVIRKRIR